MPIAYNAPITFGKSGTARDLNCVGLDFTETGTQSWTSAPVAELDVHLPPARQDVLLEIEASPFTIPEFVPAQQLFVYIGGLFVGFALFKSLEVKSFIVSRTILSGRPTRMALVLPNATSPSAAHLSEDLRDLGIYLHAIVFRVA